MAVSDRVGVGVGAQPTVGIRLGLKGEESLVQLVQAVVEVELIDGVAPLVGIERVGRAEERHCFAKEVGPLAPEKHVVGPDSRNDAAGLGKVLGANDLRAILRSPGGPRGHFLLTLLSIPPVHKVSSGDHLVGAAKRCLNANTEQEMRVKKRLKKR